MSGGQGKWGRRFSCVGWMREVRGLGSYLKQPQDHFFRSLGGMMKSLFLLFLNLLVMLALFLLGESMTTTPERSSGNGNPAILLLIPIIILFCILVFQWIKFFKEKKLTIRFYSISFVFILTYLITAINLQAGRFKRYKNHLAEVNGKQNGNIDWEYINSITDGITMHVNNQYFNLNTYLMTVSISYLIFIIFLFLKPKK